MHTSRNIRRQDVGDGGAGSPATRDRPRPTTIDDRERDGATRARWTGRLGGTVARLDDVGFGRGASNARHTPMGSLARSGPGAAPGVRVADDSTRAIDAGRPRLDSTSARTGRRESSGGNRRRPGHGARDRRERWRGYRDRIVAEYLPNRRTPRAKFRSHGSLTSVGFGFVPSVDARHSIPERASGRSFRRRLHHLDERHRRPLGGASRVTWKTRG